MKDSQLKPKLPLSRRALLLGGGVVGLGVVAGVLVGNRQGGSLPNTGADAPLPPSGVTSDSSVALMKYLSQSTGHATLSGKFFLDNEVKVPPNVSRLTLAAGSVFTVRGNHSAFTRTGVITFRETTGSPMGEGSSAITVKDVKRYAVGETILLSGQDTVPGSEDRYGYLRKITSIKANRVSFDKPLPRQIQLSPRTSAVELAPTLLIDGMGEILSNNPKTTTSPLVRLYAVDNPTVNSILIHHSGGTGISLIHCVGASIDCTISDLLDDGENYFGYGVSVAGATQNANIRGTISRVRHAVTTNTGPNIPGLGSAGEPENCRFEPIAINCTNKSVDTHRLGWGTVIVPHVTGGGGGVQVRADNTIIVGGTITGCHGPAINVGTVVHLAPTIDGTSITNLVGNQVGVLCLGPAQLKGVHIESPNGTGIQLTNNSSVSGGTVSGTAAVGIHVTGTGNQVSGLTVSSTVKVAQTAGPAASRNSIEIVAA